MNNKFFFKGPTTQKQIFVYNPLPRVTETELDEMIVNKDGSFWVDPKSSPTKEVFQVELRFDNTGAPSDGDLRFMPPTDIVFKSGESHKFFEMFEEDVKALTVNTPLVVTDSGDDLESKAIKVLQKYHTELMERGWNQIVKYKQIRGLQDHELENVKADLIGYYRNAKKADLVAQTIKNLQREVKARTQPQASTKE